MKASTSNAGVYGELARYPLYVQRYVRIVKYWCKLLNTTNCIDAENGKTNWVAKLKDLLYIHVYGFGEAWQKSGSNQS